MIVYRIIPTAQSLSSVVYVFALKKLRTGDHQSVFLRLVSFESSQEAP